MTVKRTGTHEMEDATREGQRGWEERGMKRVKTQQGSTF